MPLEAGTYITALTPTNPPSSDFRKEGDDHLRLVKNILRNTFPNAGRAWYMEDYVAKTTLYTVDIADENKLISCDATAGAFTITLPVSGAFTSATKGVRVIIQKSDASANAITIAPASGTINGEANWKLYTRYEAVLCIWTGTEWRIFPYDSPMRVRALTGDATLDVSDFESLIRVTAAATDITLTLPAAANYAGRYLYVKLSKTGVGNVILDGNGTEKIEGANTYTIDADKESVLLFCSAIAANEWFIVAHYAGSSGVSAYLDVAQNWTAAQTFDRALVMGTTTLTDANPVVWNMATSAPHVKLTLTSGIGATRVLGAPTGEIVGSFGYLDVIQSAATRALTWNAAYKFPNGVDENIATEVNSTTRYRYFVRADNDIIMKKVWVSSRNSIGWFKEYDLGTFGTSNSYIQAHGLGEYPALVQFYLENVTTELGYSVGDRLLISTLGDGGSETRIVTAAVNETNVEVYTGSNPPHLTSTGGAASAIIAARWKIIARVYE